MPTYGTLYRLLLSIALAVAAMVGTASETHESAEVERPAPQPQGYRIVSPDWVEANAANEKTRVIDVRQDLAHYFRGHVPGAVHLHDELLQETRRGLPALPASTSRIAETFGALGIGPGQDVIIYSDGEDVLSATFIAYCLERIGHASVAIMDGGFASYEESGLAVSRSVPEIEPVQYEMSRSATVPATLEDIAASIDDPDLLVYDVRPPAEYYGNADVWERKGRLDGSKNLRWRYFTEDDNLHKFAAESENALLLRNYDLDDDDTLIVVGTTAREASLVYFYARHVFGHPEVRLLEGGWAEIASRSDIELFHPKPPTIGQ